ncbi:jg9287 [Pararge aegeria aegeria]|uniref:Jg9287 protein n=1 Tax=Pararge aegeria aegeria TaxID=348720 RepID=A0A8S4SBX0_9NEOP|nr:jg9287 [Pararge aegeria aegeria]
MDSDDDTFLVIVGDAIDKSTVPSRKSIEVLTKDDKFQDIEHVYLDNDEGSTQEEQEVEENVSIKDELSTNKDSDQDFSPEDEVPVIYLDKKFPKKRPHMVKQDKRHSYIKSIQSVYPELRNDKKLLIKSLVAIMQETKPPPLPTDFYMMDGIMLQCTTCDHQSVSIPAAERHYHEKHGERYLYCLACGVNFRR